MPRRASRAEGSTRTAEYPTVRLTALSETWRSVDCGAVDAFEKNAQMAVLAVRVPDDKFKDKVVKDMRAYVCTAAEVAGRPVTYEQFRDALVGAVGDAGIARVATGHAGSSRGCARDLGQRIASLEAPDVHQADTTTGVATDDLLAALRKAVDDAKEARA